MISDLKTQYGYLVFPFNEQTKNIFMKERNTTKYIVERIGKDKDRKDIDRKDKDRKDIDSINPQRIAKDFRLILEEKGYRLTPIVDIYLCGIKEICGYVIDITKLVTNGEIKAIQIRISGIDDNDLSHKMDSIKEFLKLNCNIDPEKTDNFMFSRTDRC